MITNYLIGLILVYLFISTIDWEFNPKNWDAETRLSNWLLATVPMVVLTMIRFTPQTVTWF